MVNKRKVAFTQRGRLPMADASSQRPSSRAERTAGQSVYAPMLRAIQQDIADGILVQGDRLPTETQLSDSHGISISSVRRGIEQLVSEGLVVRRQGSGTYVEAGFKRSQTRAVRDTVAVIMPVAIRNYHPFFSEVARGIRSGLSDRGWQLWDFDYSEEEAGHLDMRVLPVDTDDLQARLLSHASLGGAILGATTAEELRALLPSSLPIVSSDETDACPFVAYDWATETRRAVDLLRRDGCQRIWLYGDALEEQMPDTIIPPLPPGRRLISQVIKHAYESTMEMLHQDRQVDGIVAGSDYAAQGILDAVAEFGASVPEDLRVACLVNRESRLAYPFPVTLLVADGFHKGLEVARLLDVTIKTPRSAPVQITPSCTVEYHI